MNRLPDLETKALRAEKKVPIYIIGCKRFKGLRNLIDARSLWRNDSGLTAKRIKNSCTAWINSVAVFWRC